jgi:tyrosine-protein kinase Etk/Wzc
MNEKITPESFYSQTESFYSQSDGADDIDVGKIFRFLLMQSKLIISIVLTVFILSAVNYYFSTKQYSMKSLLQYESVNQNIFDPSKMLEMASQNSASDLSSLVGLYESRTNYLKVIKDLKLNINIENIDYEESIDINIDSNKNNFTQNQKLKFSFSDESYALLDENLNEIETSEYGKPIRFNDLRISVNSAKLNDYRPIDVVFTYPEKMYNSFKSAMVISFDKSTSSLFSKEGLITVSYITHDTELGKKIINYANKVFLDQRVFDETEKSRKAINFIDSNIESLEASVEANKTRLKEFRERNRSIDVSLEIQAIIAKTQALEESLSAIDIELSKAQEIYTSNNPAYLNLLDKKMLIEKQKEDVLSEIEMMPKEQQEYIDLFNDLEISQALFEELESRRLGFSILEASTIADIRVIDGAYVDTIVSPRLTSVAGFTLFAFILACILAIFRGFFYLPISNPAEIFDNNIHLPIIGVIPQVDDMELNKDDVRMSTAIESLIVNINSLQNAQLDKKILTVTSPSPSNGKSTISMKLAEGFARIGKKVLLVDNDLKRGNIAKNYNIKSISEKTFNSIDATTINNYKVHDNFYIIPRVKGLSNSFQFLYSYQYKEKIKIFKENFDFIIFDTGPILSVSDSSILIDQSDFNILVTRHGVNRMNEIKQSIDNFKQINKNIDGIVYNAYAKPKSYYGYYGIYGNYSYQYYADKYLGEAYEYDKET